MHTEIRSTHAYALTVAKGGPRLLPTKADHFSGFRINVSPGQMRGLNWSMPILAKYLTSATGLPVVDRTGLTGSYDIGFSYEPSPQPESTLSSLEIALREATGLLLKTQIVPVQTVVIDSVDKSPTEN